MRFLDRDEIREATPWSRLIDAIAELLLVDGAVSPDRHVHQIEADDGPARSLLLMPSWIPDQALGVKLVTFFPRNAGTDVPTVNASYQLFDGSTGQPTAVLDGDELTGRRTAAISALAARYLARPDAARLLVIGTGQLAPNLALAHASERDLTSVEVWGRNPKAAADTVARLARSGLEAAVCDDLDRGIEQADIISTATGAQQPLVAGRLLTPGTHVDAVGSFRPDMRETDDGVITAGSLFVDTVAGACAAGDLAQPIDQGVIAEGDIAADLRALVAGDHRGRTSDDEITFFKSAGFALADLAAARLAAGH